MQITCPCCSCRFSIEAALSDQDARRAIKSALQLPPPLGELIIRYIALFRPQKRALTWSRTASLLNALQIDISRGAIERHGRLWPAPHEHWKSALEEMLSLPGKLTLPLKSHGYLYEILSGMANKEELAIEENREGARRNRPGVDCRIRTIAEINSDLNHFKKMGDLSKNPEAKRINQDQVRKLEAELKLATWRDNA